MIGRISITALALLFLGASACSVITGKEDPDASLDKHQPVRILYVETLRNQASLRGESLRETDFSSNPATSLQRPVGVSADPYRVYATERSPVPRLAVFDRSKSTMTFLSIVQIPGQVNYQFLDPAAVAVDEGATIYVADAQQGKVFGLDHNGAPQFTIGLGGELAYPVGLAVDLQRSKLYVADKQAHRVQAYTMRGVLLYEFRSADPGKQEKGLRAPVGIAVDRNGICYVLDAERSRVFLYDPNGLFLRSFAVRPSGRGGAIKPAGIAVDSAGHVYVSDAESSVIMIFGQDGTFLQSWGGTGSQREDLWSPAGIFIDARDYIYIADQMNGRIQVFQFLK